MVDDVLLRPVWREDLDWVESVARRGPDNEYDDFGWQAVQVRDQWAADGLLGDDRGELLIVVGGRPVGDVGWRGVRYGRSAGSRAWNIGIWVQPDHRGRGVGSRAQRLLADYLFAHTTVNRVEASTDVRNVAEQRALDRAGFTREGVLRGAQYRLGSWHDLVGYSRLRSDP